MEQTTDRSAMRIASYNLHGLNQGTDILQHVCEDVELSMIMIQEHWQSCDNLNKILCFSTDFTGYGICAFENKINSGIMIGRPYGGVAILIRDHLVKFVNKIICEERFVILCIQSVAFVNVYLPTKSCKDYVNLLRSTLELIDMHLKSIDPDHIVVGGDFNVDMRSRSNTSSRDISEFVDHFNLIECSTPATPSIQFTFRNSSGCRTWIDWFLVSRSLHLSVVSFDILDIEPNNSDHLPIVLDLYLPVSFKLHLEVSK